MESTSIDVGSGGICLDVAVDIALTAMRPPLAFFARPAFRCATE
jgi:hypothetical protein